MWLLGSAVCFLIYGTQPVRGARTHGSGTELDDCQRYTPIDLSGTRGSSTDLMQKLGRFPTLLS